MDVFDERLKWLVSNHKEVMARKNDPMPSENGIYDRYRYPVIAREHTPLFWKYDLDRKTNPYLMERIGVNCALNPGAIEFEGQNLPDGARRRHGSQILLRPGSQRRRHPFRIPGSAHRHA